MPSLRNAGDVQTLATSASPLASMAGAVQLPGGVVIDATNAYDGSNTSFETLIRAGWILAQNTSTKKYVPCKRSRANGAGSATATLIVDNAAAFKAGDAITINATAAVISSIVYSTNTITLTATKTWSDRDIVFCSTNGTGTATCVLGEDVDLYQIDTRANADSTAGTVYVQGLLKSDRVLGDLASIRAVSGNLITKNFNVDTDV
jgi:hypothetical protein